MKAKLRAVHDDDLKAVLESLGVYNKFIEGKLACAFCKGPITWDNLHSLFPDSGATKFCCSRPECVRGLVIKLEKKSYG